MPPATAPRISRPHRHTAVLPMDGSERRCQRLQETFRRTASLWMAVKDAANVCKKRSAEQLHADGLTMGKVADILPWSAEVTAVTAHPLGRAHGTLQPEWMKVL